jgi:hypothetical protein
MRTTWMLGVGALLAAWAAPAEVAVAGKPSGGAGGGSGSTGGGTIWFVAADGDYVMNSDGSGKTPAPEGVGGNTRYEFVTHGGHRWFLRARPGSVPVPPNGAGNFQEYFAVRDDVAMTVQLTDSSVGLEVVDPYLAGGGHWTPDGLALSWAARRRSNGEVDAGGIYVAPLAFDADGNVTGLVAQPSAPTWSLPLTGDAANRVPDVSSFSWSPDGTRFVYDTVTSYDSWNAQTRVVDLAAGGDRFLLAGSRPGWSPDGGRIVWYEARRRDYHVVGADGASDRTLLKANPWTSYSDACWSPTGSHIAYTQWYAGGSGTIYRVASTGGSSPVNLTPESGWMRNWTQ